MRFMACLCLLLLAAAPAQGAEYFSAPEDLPLMAGMTETADGAVVFDTPQGRIVEAAARTAASASDVRAFYARTLPALGWSPEGEDAFRRAGETLVLKCEAAAGGTLARFTLSPAS